MVLNNFVVFEGIDGAGTSTQIEILKNSILKDKIDFSAEPTSEETGVFLRKVLSSKIVLEPKTIAYLFAADRAEHVYGKKGIINSINNNKCVVIDRYIFSSLAYQSVSCSKEFVYSLNKDFPLPQILFFFDITPDKSLERIKNRDTREIYENLDYLEKTRNQYLSVIEEYKNNSEAKDMQIIIIDATKPIDEISNIILNSIQNLPIFKM